MCDFPLLAMIVNVLIIYMNYKINDIPCFFQRIELLIYLSKSTNGYNTGYISELFVSSKLNMDVLQETAIITG